VALALGALVRVAHIIASAPLVARGHLDQALFTLLWSRGTSHASTTRRSTTGLGNAMGGIRYPMGQEPIASFGVGKSVFSGDCPEIVPFAQATLQAITRRGRATCSSTTPRRTCRTSRDSSSRRTWKRQAIAREVTSVD
jgi:hypothetical protein